MNYFKINLKGMESRFSNVFFACCASWFLQKILEYRILSSNTAAQIYCSRICDVPYEEETSWPQVNSAWRRTISNRTNLSTGRRTSTTWRRRRKKRFTRTCTYKEYGLVCLLEICFYDERRRVPLCQELDVLSEKIDSSGLYSNCSFFKSWTI